MKILVLWITFCCTSSLLAQMDEIWRSICGDALSNSTRVPWTAGDDDHIFNDRTEFDNSDTPGDNSDTEPNTPESNPDEVDALVMDFTEPITLDLIIDPMELELLQIIIQGLSMELRRLALNTAILFEQPNSDRHGSRMIAYFVQEFLINNFLVIKENLNAGDINALRKTTVWLILWMNWLIRGARFNVDLLDRYVFTPAGSSEQNPVVSVWQELSFFVSFLTWQQCCWILDAYRRNLNRVENLIELRARAMRLREVLVGNWDINDRLYNPLLSIFFPANDQPVPAGIIGFSSDIQPTLARIDQIELLLTSWRIVPLEYQIPTKLAHENDTSLQICERLGLSTNTWRQQQEVVDDLPLLIPLFRCLSRLKIHLKMVVLLVQMHFIPSGLNENESSELRAALQYVMENFDALMRNWQIFQLQELTDSHQAIFNNFWRHLILIARLVVKIKKSDLLGLPVADRSIQALETFLQRPNDPFYYDDLEASVRLLDEQYLSVLFQLWYLLIDRPTHEVQSATGFMDLTSI